MDAVAEGRFADARTALSEAKAAYDSVGMDSMHKAIDELQQEIDEAEAEENAERERQAAEKTQEDASLLSGNKSG